MEARPDPSRHLGIVRNKHRAEGAGRCRHARLRAGRCGLGRGGVLRRGCAPGIAVALVLAAGAATFGGCGGSTLAGRPVPQVVIRVEGSDTMVNLAQAWAEHYHRTHSLVSVQVLGGGSGVGIASLIDGNCDLANSSRAMNPSEIAEARRKRGQDPVEHVVGYDAMAIFVHPMNPLDTISLPELADIYGEAGRTTRWSQLGVRHPTNDQIVRINRQNSSGTYSYFREVVLGKKDFKLGSVDAHGSKDVVALISRTPAAIGYSGMGYQTPGVKVVKVSKEPGAPGVKPTAENARRGAYPITRPLLIYTLGEPTGPVKEYLDWIRSREGQRIVVQLGYVPLESHE